jgi:hypothetical protein
MWWTNKSEYRFAVAGPRPAVKEEGEVGNAGV